MREKAFLVDKYNHPKDNIIGKLDEGMWLQTRIINQVLYMCSKKLEYYVLILIIWICI